VFLCVCLSLSWQTHRAFHSTKPRQGEKAAFLSYLLLPHIALLELLGVPARQTNVRDYPTALPAAPGCTRACARGAPRRPLCGTRAEICEGRRRAEAAAERFAAAPSAAAVLHRSTDRQVLGAAEANRPSAFVPAPTNTFEHVCQSAIFHSSTHSIPKALHGLLSTG
jgi:hypothetical protein